MFDSGEVSPVLAGIPENKRPTGDCSRCNAALWFVGGEAGNINLFGHCSAMDKPIYDGTNKNAPRVINCSALQPLGDS